MKDRATRLVSILQRDSAHGHPITKTFLLFLIHQAISTAGVGLLVVFLATSLLEISRLMTWQFPEYVWYRIFTYRPFFPVQTLTGFYFGWLLARRLGHRAMIWVWILPLLALFYAVLAIPTFTPEITSPLLWSGTSQSWLTHYFGWGCRMKDRCFDQVLVTQPFYSATAYAIGARIAFFFTAPRPAIPRRIYD